MDKRQDTLVDRANAQLENQVNNITTQTEKDKYDANTLASIAYEVENTDPTVEGYQQMVTGFSDAYKQASPIARVAVDNVLKGIETERYKSTTESNNAKYGSITSTEQFVKNVGEAHVRQMTQASDIINNPNSTPEQVAQAKQVYQQANTGLSKLGISSNTIAGMSSAVAKEFNKAKEAEAESKQKQANKDRDYELKKYTATSNVSIGQQKADADTLRAYNSGSSNDNSTSTKNMSPAKKALHELGLSDYVKNGTLSAPQIGNAMVSILDGIFRQEKAKENEESFNTWINNKGAEYKNAIFKDRFWGSKLVGDTSRYDDIISAFPKDATEYEKKQIIMAMADEYSKYARWLTTGDDAQSAVQNALSAIRLGREAEIRSLQGKKMDEILTNLAAETGQSKTATYGALIRRDPSVGWDAPEWFVNLAPELRDYYINKTQAKNPPKPKEKPKEKPKDKPKDKPKEKEATKQIPIPSLQVIQQEKGATKQIPIPSLQVWDQ